MTAARGPALESAPKTAWIRSPVPHLAGCSYRPIRPQSPHHGRETTARTVSTRGWPAAGDNVSCAVGLPGV